MSPQRHSHGYRRRVTHTGRVRWIYYCVLSNAVSYYTYGMGWRHMPRRAIWILPFIYVASMAAVFFSCCQLNSIKNVLPDHIKYIYSIVYFYYYEIRQFLRENPMIFNIIVKNTSFKSSRLIKSFASKTKAPTALVITYNGGSSTRGSV